MLLSLFTPTHRPTHLLEVYASLQRQEQCGADWEWVIVPNGSDTITLPETIVQDDHVRVVPTDLTGIGALKNFACSQCRGDMFIEMDHDDTLTPTCFKELAEAMTKTPDGFYYSDFINLRTNNTCETYDPSFGWICYPITIDYQDYTACAAFEPSARSICHIFYAPNHVRAWSRAAYARCGGHPVELAVGDDHDIVCRTYIAGVPFVRIDKPLYIYRRWEKQSYLKYNKEIQIQQQQNCDKYIHELVVAECQHNNYRMLDIGSPDWCPEIYENISIGVLDRIDDSSVGCIRAIDMLQLVPRSNIVRLMNDLYRVLRPGGWLLTSTPSIDDGNGRPGRGAFQDPRHCSYWSANNFLYYTEKKYANLLTDYNGRFQEVRLFTNYPSDWHKQNQIPYVSADLCALKGQRQPGEVRI